MSFLSNLLFPRTTGAKGDNSDCGTSTTHEGTGLGQKPRSNRRVLRAQFQLQRGLREALKVPAGDFQHSLLPTETYGAVVGWSSPNRLKTGRFQNVRLSFLEGFMCAVVTTANKIASRAKPRFRERNTLTAFWVTKAMEHSGKSSSELAAAMSDDGVSTNQLSDSERVKFARYADISSEGSMDFKSLAKFISKARERGLLPKRSGILEGKEDLLLGSPDPEQYADDLKKFQAIFEKRRASLNKALSEYIECVHECFDLSGNTGIGRFFVLLDSHSTTPEDDDSAESIDLASTMDLEKLREILHSINGHVIVNLQSP